MVEKKREKREGMGKRKKMNKRKRKRVKGRKKERRHPTPSVRHFIKEVY